MIHDRPRNRLVTYNGSSVVWKLDLETLVWNTIFPAEPWPSNGFYRGVIYDAARQRLIVAGRWNYDTSSITDVWELPLDSSPVWTQLTPAGSPPPTRYGHSCVYDPVNGRMVLFGGVSFSGSHNDAWFLDWAPVPVGVDDQISKENVSLAARWNRNTSSIDVSFTLPTSGSARLELYDLSGRRVDAQHHELPAGAHSASFARGSPSSGVYMLALRHESGTIAKKVAVLR
jgi:hypothetical protein